MQTLIPTSTNINTQYLHKYRECGQMSTYIRSSESLHVQYVRHHLAPCGPFVEILDIQI